MRLSEQLGMAIATGMSDSGFRADGLIVKLLDLTHDKHPGRSARGVLPVVVVGHENMTAPEWSEWVRQNGAQAYGPMMVERFLQDGIDLRELSPTSSFGRVIRQSRTERWKGPGWSFSELDLAENVLTLVEQFPQLYNLLAQNMAEEEMTLSTFIGRVESMPTPFELNAGRYHTLGDILSRRIVATPSF